MAATDPVSVSIKPGEWNRLKRELDDFEPALAKALRRRIKTVGEEAVTAVRETVRQPAPSDGDDSIGSREAIARATRLSVSFAAKTAGVKIVTGGIRGGFSKAYNKGTFRHPVHGRSVYVEQQGRPYFGAAITRSMRVELVKNIALALDDAVRAIGGRVI